MIDKNTKSDVKYTEYYTDFLRYVEVARKMQEKCNLGTEYYPKFCGDQLMESVRIYDYVDRRYSSLSDILQDMWFGSASPKYFKQKEERKKIIDSFDGLRGRWNKHQWLYVFFVHRITGSAASYDYADHGYRNTILPDLAKLNSIEEMVDFITKHEETMYSNVAYQHPPFSIDSDAYETRGKTYLCIYLPELVKHVWKYIDKVNAAGKVVTIKDVVDVMCNWNNAKGMPRFNIQYCLVAADLADYFPEHVDETSSVYCRALATEALSLFAYSEKKIKKEDLFDIIMKQAVEDTGLYPKDLEDVMSAYVRYLENFIPVNRENTYGWICRKKVWNNSNIQYHRNGRQKWKLDTEYWEW
jgi:hypothetical protein